MHLSSKLLDNIKSEEFIKYMDLIPTLEPNIKEMLCSDNLLPEDKIKLGKKEMMESKDQPIQNFGQNNAPWQTTFTGEGK